MQVLGLWRKQEKILYLFFDTFILYGNFCFEKMKERIICVYVCVCVCVCVCACVRACSSVRLCRFMYVFVYICTYVVYV